jgi:peptidoglycan/LPS O-acetylase OafA/YrhL
VTAVAEDAIPDDVGGLESAARTHPPDGFLPGFDGLRALAALLVVVFHAASLSGLLGRSSAGSLLGETSIGVSVFFVLSGFLLYRPFVAANLDGRPRPRTGAYLVRRALRILPAYWVALTAIVFVFHREVINGVGDGIVFYGLFQIYSGEHIFGGLNQAWSLSTEVAFYLFLPAWAALLGRLGRDSRRRSALEGCGLVLLVLIAFVWRTVLVQQGHRIGYAWLPAHLDTFALGMGLAVVGRGAKGPVRALAARPWLCWGAATALFLVLANLRLPQGLVTLSLGQRHARHVIFELVAVLLVLPAALARPGDRSAVHRILASPVLASLGLVSYGIFLWHQFWIGEAVRWTGGQELASRFWPVLALALLCMIPTAAVSYVAIEQPIITAWKRSHRRRPGRGAVIEGAVLVLTGYALGRVLGAGVALGGLALARRRGPATVALGAVLALGAAAVLTMVSAADPVRFADRVRSDPVLASRAGLVAALLLLVAVLEFARVERRSAVDEEKELGGTSPLSLSPRPPVEEPIDAVSWTVDSRGRTMPTESTERPERPDP